MTQKRKNTYNQNSKECTMRYMKGRDRLSMNFPLGTKARYMAFAEFYGKSFTAMIDELILKAMEETGYDEEKYLSEYLKRKEEEMRQKAAENTENAAPEE